MELLEEGSLGEQSQPDAAACQSGNVGRILDPQDCLVMMDADI